MDILDLFWPICKIAIALIMFAGLCYGLFVLYKILKSIIIIRLMSERIKDNRRWLLSLDQVHLLALTTKPDAGLDIQDKDGIIELTLNKKLSASQRDAIINRIAAHLNRQYE